MLPASRLKGLVPEAGPGPEGGAAWEGEGDRLLDGSRPWLLPSAFVLKRMQVPEFGASFSTLDPGRGLHPHRVHCAGR